MNCNCPKIKPKDWTGIKNWKNKTFYVKEFIKIGHKPINIGTAIKKGFSELKEKKYQFNKPYIILQEETGLLKGKLLFEIKKPTTKDPKVEEWKGITRIHTKYYKGSFKGIGHEFNTLIKCLGRKPNRLFTWTVNCPECWKKEGVINVLFAIF